MNARYHQLSHAVALSLYHILSHYVRICKLTSEDSRQMDTLMQQSRLWLACPVVMATRWSHPFIDVQEGCSRTLTECVKVACWVWSRSLRVTGQEHSYSICVCWVCFCWECVCWSVFAGSVFGASVLVGVFWWECVCWSVFANSVCAGIAESMHAYMSTTLPPHGIACPSWIPCAKAFDQHPPCIKRSTYQNSVVSCEDLSIPPSR